MYIKSIEKQIEEWGDQVESIQKRFTVGDITPFPYQAVCYLEIAKRIRRYEHPFFIKASVSAGKTIVIAMVAAQCKALGLPMMVLARQAEIVSQDSEEVTNFGVPNSVYCSGLNTKSAYFPIVIGSEGTVVNGLFKALGDVAPMVLCIDECHEVNWEDLAEAIDNGETFDQMSRRRDQPYKIDDQVVPADYEVFEGFDKQHVVEFGTGRSQYTIIIMELMRRCREAHGKELRIFGLTGSEFRGVTPILTADKKQIGFWREQVTNIDTNYLVKFGSVVPTNFGDNGGVGYDLSEFQASNQDGTQDFTPKQMREMEKKIHASGSMTQQIMAKVAQICESRNGVLVTCAGERHCKEAAAALPPGATYCIITGKTGEKQRAAYLKDAFEGKIKYVFQVNALTTGVNIPYWDTSVILRKIGSLTLLIQLLGRGMRKLKRWHLDHGFTKDDHLVLDFAGCMDEMGSLYFDPILEEQQYQSRFRTGKDPKKCELCGTMNSFYARRCMGKDHLGNRCEYFWKFKECEDQKDARTGEVKVRGCGSKNDIVARICRCCDVTLLDPNEKLTSKHYKKSDYFDVREFDVTLTKNQAGVVFRYVLSDGEITFKAHETFFPQSDNHICRAKWRDACEKHIADKQQSRVLASIKNAVKIVSHKDLIRAPRRTTHRKTEKGGDNLYHKEF